jgi:integrase
LVTLLYFTGCRLGEAKKIRWEQVDLEQHQIRLEGDQTKNSEPRILPLPEELIEMLHQLQKHSGQYFQAPISGRRGLLLASGQDSARGRFYRAERADMRGLSFTICAGVLSAI